MHKNDLLQRLEGQTYSQRMRHMAQLGRESGASPAARALIAELEQGGAYERVLAAQSCYGSRDNAHIARAAADPSPDVRAVALGLVPRSCDDDQVQSLFAKLPRAARRALCKRLLRQGRQELLDSLVLARLAHEDRDGHVLLDFASVPIVERHLESWLREAQGADAIRMALRYPALVVEALLAACAGQTTLGQARRRLINEILPDLSRQHVDHALALVRGLADVVTMDKLELEVLRKCRPTEIVRLALKLGERVYEDTSRSPTPHLTVQELVALSALHETSYWAGYLQHLRPQERVQIFEIVQADQGWSERYGQLEQLVPYLPAAYRADKARELIGRAKEASSDRWDYWAAEYLPWAEAHAVLSPWLRSSNAELRTVALSTAIGVAAYQREHLGDVLDVVLNHRHEPAHIRTAMLHALSRLPPGIWQAQHLAQLAQLLELTLGDVLRSHSTFQALENLLAGLLNVHPEWAADWIARVLRERSHMVCAFPYNRPLCRVRAPQLGGPLLKLLRDWARQEREDEIIAVARMLGYQLRHLDGVLELLEQLARTSESAQIAQQALECIGLVAPRRLDALVPALLEQDQSWITQQRVSHYLHQRRQDLLTPFLGAGPYPGRFSAGRASFIIPLTGELHRLTPAQQARRATTLDAAIEDREQDMARAATAVVQLAALPFIPPDKLLARSDDERVPVRDAALRMLRHVDPAVALPALLAALQHQGAAAASTALRVIIRRLPPGVALKLLRELPAERLVVVKERVRLLGMAGTDEAYAELLALAERPLHPDVQIALLRALSEFSERESSWAPIMQAATSHFAAVALTLKSLPIERLSPAGRRRALEALAMGLQHPDASARKGLLEHLERQQPRDEEQVLRPALLALLRSMEPGESYRAASTSVAIYAAQPGVLEELVREVRPLRHVVSNLKDAWSREHRRNRRLLAPAGAALLRGLEGDPYTAELRAELAVRLLAGRGPEDALDRMLERISPKLPDSEVEAEISGDQLADIFGAMAARGELHAGALMAAVQAFGKGDGHAARFAELAQFEQRLGTDPDPRLRRLALAALVALREGERSYDQRSWNKESRERLEAYRNDPDLMVATAALFIATD